MKTTPIPLDQYELRTISHNPIHPSIIRMSQNSSINKNKNKNKYPRIILSNSSKCHPISTVSFIYQFELIILFMYRHHLSINHLVHLIIMILQLIYLNQNQF